MRPTAVLTYAQAAAGESPVRAVAGATRGLIGRDLGSALAAAAADLPPDAAIAWIDERHAGLETGRWGDRLGRAHQIRHLGFATTPDTVLRAFQAVAGEDPFVVPGGRCRATWLLGGTGVTSAAALHALGPLDPPSTGGTAVRLARYGLRAFDSGVLAFHDLHLGATTAEDRWTRRDRRELIAHRWGASRRGPALMARLLPPSPFAPVHGPWQPASAADLGRELVDGSDVDVVVPTLDRPGPLAALLDDLACQAPPPRRVVVVEQRPDGSRSALDALRQGDWPFELRVETSSEMGASRARNRALQRTSASWIALLDDDVRLAPGLLAAMVAEAVHAGADALSIEEREPDALAGRTASESPSAGPPPRPVAAVGSGRSIVRRRALAAVGGFDETIEGWGEDVELGLRLHRAGFTVLASRRLALIHLKVPQGGFRHPRPVPWANGIVRPLPSPLIAYRWRRHMPPAMLGGMVRTHLLRAARHRALGPLALPWLWLRWRASRRWSKRLGPPRLARIVEPSP